MWWFRETDTVYAQREPLKHKVVPKGTQGSLFTGEHPRVGLVLLLRFYDYDVSTPPDFYVSGFPRTRMGGDGTDWRSSTADMRRNLQA